MKSFLITLIKPTGAWARWLVFLMLAGIVAAGVTGHLEIARTYLDTDSLTFEVGNVRISAYTVLRALAVLALVFWTTAIIVDVVDSRLEKLTKMRSTTRIRATDTAGLNRCARASIDTV